MLSCTPRRFVLLAVLLFAASGILGSLGLAGHDHDPGQACRICPTVHSVDTADVARAALVLEIWSAPVPPPIVELPSPVDLLVASPLRGPPA